MSTAEGRHLVLIGLMGSGKTTVGRVLAQRLQRELLDSDQMIEAREGRTVRSIFQTDGEDAFRAIETEVLVEALAAERKAVIAAAGGVVLRDANRAALRDSGARIVWLRANPDTLVERVKGGVHRPLLDDDPRGTLTRMDAERSDLYRSLAHAVVSVDNRTVNEIADAVLR